MLNADAGAWPEILSSIGLVRQPANLAHVFVARTGTPASNEWNERVDQGAIMILEGESSLAEMFGFRRGAGFVKVGSLTDVHRPGLAIVWEKGLELPVFDLPAGAVVFARERWTGTPMMAGMRRGAGVLLWVAVPPGERGYERFPYVLQALTDLGMERPFASARLWAFFDSAYRSRVDLDYFAARWRSSGVAALHVAAWHFWEADPEQDAYLEKLIAACHREGILVYAWLELPHVSEKFWAAHPEWREKTAILQDAQLDWRKLMNLTNRDCFRVTAEATAALVKRFDWDGVNLAELYFESLEGIGNPARFTPMNDDVRREFRALGGVDPIDLFGRSRDGAAQKQFLDYRAELARRMEEEWLAVLQSLRREKPDLDLVLTQVDDRFDTGMREAIGADAARVLPMLDAHSFTFLIEDPATVWNLGPQRYQAIAERYRAITNSCRQTGYRPEYRRPLPERLPDQAADGYRAVRTGAQRRAQLRSRYAIFRELAAGAGPRAAAFGCRHGHPGRAYRAEAGGGFGARRGRSVERPGHCGWPTVAGAGRGNRVAARRVARHRSIPGRVGPVPAAAERRVESRPQSGRALDRIHLQKRRPRHRRARPHTANHRDRFEPRHGKSRRPQHSAAAARPAHRDIDHRVS